MRHGSNTDANNPEERKETTHPGREVGEVPGIIPVQRCYTMAGLYDKVEYYSSSTELPQDGIFSYPYSQF